MASAVVSSWNDDASAIVLRGGGRGTSSVDLGTGCFPLEDGPVTIEVWATQNAVQNWSRVFDIGSDTGDYLLISWTRGTTAASDCANLNYRNVGEVFRGEDKLGVFELGTKFHISMTLTPRADGFVDVKWSKRDAMTGHVIAASSATTKTTFRIVHDRADSKMNVIIDIFDISGRHLWTHNESDTYSGNTLTIDWDLTTGGGSRLGTGVYLYRVQLSSEGSSYVSKAKKLIVLTNK